MINKRAMWVINKHAMLNKRVSEIQKMHVRIEIKNNLNTHKSKIKNDEKVDMMII